MRHLAAMARSCGADPEAMTCRDGLDLAAYLKACDQGCDPRGGRRWIEERVVSDA